MRRWINRLAWKVVRATATNNPPMPRCLFCYKRHRTLAAYNRCTDLAIQLRAQY